jgi:hypothetical protein
MVLSTTNFQMIGGGSITIGRDCGKRLHSVLDPRGPTLVALHGDL